jgi:hypothetical protein
MKFFPAAAAVLAAVALSGGIGAAQSTVLEKRGGEINAQVSTALSSKTNADGDPFVLVVHDTFFHRTPNLKGAVIEGHLEGVTKATPTHAATMRLIFDDLKLPDGTTEPVDLKVVSIHDFEPHTHHVRDVGIIVGGVVAGHIASKRSGVKGGTLTGAAAGFAIASSLKSDITVKPGTNVKLRANTDIGPPGTH